jgi:hypothetical protein
VIGWRKELVSYEDIIRNLGRRMKMAYQKSRIVSSFLCWLLLLAALVSAQSTPPPASPVQQQKAAGEGARATQTTSQPTSQEAEQKISPQEAEELFRSVDEILQFASKDTSLPIKHPVKRKLTSRDEVVAYITKHMSEDEDAQRLRRSELVLKKFGLLPRNFDLQTFLLALLREQVAGYYDPKTKTVNLLDWVDVEQQRPVLAHELTHALQDQSFGLEKWMKAGASDLVNNGKDPTQADIENDETAAARQAVVEGQAMVVLIDYMLAPTGQSLKDSPQIVEALKQGMLVGTADSIQFHNAPLYLKEALTFPYRYGIDFVADVLAKDGKEKAFAGVFANPPRTTREIMQPKTYLSGEHLEAMRLPNFPQIFKSYEPFDSGAVGEFDVAVLIDQYAGSKTSHDLYPHWRGGYYYAARPKSTPDAVLGLLYVSRWSTPEKSAEFAAIYARSLEKRYRRTHQNGENQVKDLDILETLTGRHTWATEDGPVVIDVQGDTVMVTESLDQEVTKKLEQELIATSGGNGRAK